jgi:hypothetical protein
VRFFSSIVRFFVIILGPFEPEFSQQDDIRFKMYGNELYEGPIDIVTDLAISKDQKTVQDRKNVQGEWCLFYWQFCQWQSPGALFLRDERRLVLSGVNEGQRCRM